MGLESGLYKIIKVLHIAAVMYGLGSVLLGGLYGKIASDLKGAEGLAVSEANFKVSNVAEKIIFSIPVWGILLVLLSDDVWEFSQMWVGLSIVLYVVAVGLATGILVPSHRKINDLSRELVSMGPPPAGSAPSGPPPQVAEIEALGKKMAAAGAATNILAVVLIALMIFKPGL